MSVATEIVKDLAASEIHYHSIKPYGRSKHESMQGSASGCRVVYNLYIGSIMNREACFALRNLQEDEQELCIHSIREDVDYG